MKTLAFLVILISSQTIYCEKARFDNYRVYSIVIDDNEQLQVLQQLENNPDGLSFMMPPTHNQSMIEIIVPPHKFAEFSELCEMFNMKKELKVENLQRFVLCSLNKFLILNKIFYCSLIDEEQPEVLSRAAFGWKQYHTITEIYDWLDQQLRQHPRVLTNINIGKSYEKRIIRAVKLSHRPESVYNPKKGMCVRMEIY